MKDVSRLQGSTWLLVSATLICAAVAGCSSSDPAATRVCELATDSMDKYRNPNYLGGAPVSIAEEVMQLADEIKSDEIRLAAKSIQPDSWAGWSGLEKACG